MFPLAISRIPPCILIQVYNLSILHRQSLYLCNPLEHSDYHAYSLLQHLKILYFACRMLFRVSHDFCIILDEIGAFDRQSVYFKHAVVQWRWNSLVFHQSSLILCHHPCRPSYNTHLAFNVAFWLLTWPFGVLTEPLLQWKLNCVLCVLLGLHASVNNIKHRVLYKNDFVLNLCRRQQ